MTKSGTPALRAPGVLSYVVGSLVRSLGHSMRITVLGWQLYERTNSAWSLGLIGLVQVVPVVGLMLRAGNAADRYSRRKIGALTQLAQMLVGLALAAVSFTNAPIAIIYAALFCSGIAGAFAAPALPALLPEIVPPEQLGEVNAWTAVSWHIAAILGPAVAGLLLGVLGHATPLYIFDAASAACFSIILWRLPTNNAPSVTARPRTPHDLAAGLRFVFRCPELLAALSLDLFASLLGGASALFPIFARDILHVGPMGLGCLLAAPSCGSLLAASVLTRLRPWAHAGRVMLVSIAGFGVATLVFGLSRSFPLSLAMLFLTGTFDVVSVVIRRTLEQVVTPDHLRGRVAAVHGVFIGLSDELSEFESGATAVLFGAAGSVLLGGVGTLVVVMVAAIVWPSVRRIGRLDELKPREDLARAVLGEA